MITRNTTARSRMAQQEKGFTLTEIAIVLGIIGLILGAIWTAASSVYSNQRVNHANTALMQIVSGIRSLYATSGSDTGMTITSLYAANALPTDLSATGGTTMISPFPGGATTIVPTTDGYGFLVTMSGLTTASCISMLMNIAGSSRDPGLSNATAATTALATPASVGNPLTVVATPALANATIANGFGGCNAAATGLIVSFVFSLK